MRAATPLTMLPKLHLMKYLLEVMSAARSLLLKEYQLKPAQLDSQSEWRLQIARSNDGRSSNMAQARKTKSERVADIQAYFDVIYESDVLARAQQLKATGLI